MQVTDALVYSTVDIKKKEQLRRKRPKSLSSGYEPSPHK